MFIVANGQSESGINKIMNLKNCHFYLGGDTFICVYIAITLLLLSLNVSAKTIEVTAEYTPQSYDINGDSFNSTTKCSQGASGMLNYNCVSGVLPLDNLFFPISMDMLRTTKEKFSDPKDAFTYLGIPRKRNVVLTSESGDKYTVSFLPKTIGIHYSTNVDPDIGRQFFNNKLSSIIGGCNQIDKYMEGGKSTSEWMVLWQGSAGNRCHTKASVLSSGVVKAVLFGFAIKPPSPINIPNGKYKGSLELSIGKDGDISLGNGIYSDNVLLINITLVVNHQFKIMFPMNGNRVELQPPRGWHDWIHRNNRGIPEKLEATLSARIWTSAKYNVKVKCQYLNQVGDDCMIKNEKNHSAIVRVYATGINRRLWPIYASKHENFSGHTVLSGEERPFKFEITGWQLSEMMKRPGSRYKGDITIMIDVLI
ncbi:hypothetical protein LEO78_04880 [Aeromonas hydrophila]|uniref:hypothetical protein n=1 Tax=Aeromonas hydrophila TaxID=644 RepID=UPI001CF03502|nr:hypothetical protein [Aeromonas hydrophila]UCM62594.1 hypothetical protein LEO78_04880 [Aeromonas hydrophila]